MKFYTNKYDMAQPTDAAIEVSTNTEFMLNLEMSNKGEKAPIASGDIWIFEDGAFEEPEALNFIDGPGQNLVNDTNEDKIEVSRIGNTYGNSQLVINGMFWDPKWFKFKIPQDNFTKVYSLGDPELEAIGITSVTVFGTPQATQEVLASYTFYPNGTIIDNMTGEKTTDYIKIGYSVGKWLRVEAPVLIPANTTTADRYNIHFAYYGHAPIQIRPYDITDKGTRKIVADFNTIDITKDKNYSVVVKQKSLTWDSDKPVRDASWTKFIEIDEMDLSPYARTTIYADQIKFYEGFDHEPLQEVAVPKCAFRFVDGNGKGWNWANFNDIGKVFYSGKEYVRGLPITNGCKIASASQQYSGTATSYQRRIVTNDELNFKQKLQLDIKSIDEGSIEKPQFTKFVTMSGVTTGGDSFSYEVPVK